MSISPPSAARFRIEARSNRWCRPKLPSGSGAKRSTHVPSSPPIQRCSLWISRAEQLSRILARSSPLPPLNVRLTCLVGVMAVIRTYLCLGFLVCLVFFFVGFLGLGGFLVGGAGAPVLIA